MFLRTPERACLERLTIAEVAGGNKKAGFDEQVGVLRIKADDGHDENIRASLFRRGANLFYE